MTDDYYITKLTNPPIVDYFPTRYNIYDLGKSTPTHESKRFLYLANNPIKFNLYSIETNTLKELYESNT